MDGNSEPGRRLAVLLVEDNPADARLVRMALTSSLGATIEIKEAVRLSDAIEALEAATFDIVLLDLGLPDSRGLETFSVLHARFRPVPVVVLSVLADEATTLDAVRLGAQDYLIKGNFDTALLARVIRHAIERQQTLQQLEKSLAYVRKLLQELEESAVPGAASAGLVMCSCCRKLRAASGRWQTIEEYLTPSAQTQLTHEACPDCAAQFEQEPRGNGLTKP